jgi:hypothetical protein
VVSGTHFKFERYRPSPTLASLSLIVKTIIDFANLFVDITITEENEDEGNVGEAFEGGGVVVTRDTFLSLGFIDEPTIHSLRSAKFILPVPTSKIIKANFKCLSVS